MRKLYEKYEDNGRNVIKGIGYHSRDKIENIKELVKKASEKFGIKTAFKYKSYGKVIEKTYIDFENDINALGTELYAMGLKDEKIAVMSENRYEWGVAYLSVINGLGTGVPFDKYLPKNEIENLTKRSKIKAIFFSGQFIDIMKEISKENKYVKYFICFDNIENSEENFYNLSQLIGAGRKKINTNNADYINLPVENEKMSILLFTSGTTSLSKGVMLSHKNIVTDIEAITTLIDVREDDVHLSLLPLHHTFENTIGFLFMVHSGVCIAYSEGIRHITQNLNEFNVTFLVAVPAIYEAMYNKIQDGIKKSGKEKLVIFLIKLSNFLRRIGIDVRKHLFKSIREKVGYKLRFMACGAAPISKSIIQSYESIGIAFLQGYGLTETSPLVCATNPYKNKYGTVGWPIDEIEVTIDNPDGEGMGELLVKGGNVMLGYYENKEETLEAFTTDGWFKTGDLAKLGKDNEVIITGRAKSMIVFTNGKKAFPEEYEMLINKIEGVKESFVWGDSAPDGDIQVCAKIIIDENENAEEMRLRIENAIKELNLNIPKYKIIRYFVMGKESLTRTTTLKIKRNIEKNKMESYLKEKNTTMRKANKSII